MPTGYTSEIYEGKDVSAKDFIMQCARAFGATIMMRDDPLDKEIPVFEPHDYSFKGIRRAKKELEKYTNMTLEEAQIKLDEVYEEEVKRVEERLKEIEVLRDRYTKFLNEVKAWNPPTEDHENLKNYAINQLEESIKFDCNTCYIKQPVKGTAEEYIQMMIESAKKDLGYHEKEWAAEVERTNGRNKWIKELKLSLEDLS